MSNVSSLTSTIIIPAYNEASTILNTLKNLTVQSSNANDKLAFQILVICNGCSDNTEELVTKNFPRVHCFSIKQASKALAIRYAESLKPGFPRLYLDADIELSNSDATSLFSLARSTSSATLFIPGSVIDTQRSSLFVKRFYRAWEKTPFTQVLGYGAGTYLLNNAGRERFDIWPELIADDAFVRSQFSAQEIQVVTACKVSVKAPKNIPSLIMVKARSKYGNLQLKKYFELGQHHKFDHKQSLKFNVGPTKIFDKLVYNFINLTALLVAKVQHLTGSKIWLRDHSNR